MAEELRPEDPRLVWKSQQLVPMEVNMQSMINRRTRELRARTRTEIIASICAALGFVSVAGWRFVTPGEWLLQTALGLFVIWTVISIYRFRNRIWGRDQIDPQVLAAPAVEHYRRELQERRDHLRSVWIWNGPLLLSFLFLILTIARKVAPNYVLLRNGLPFFVLTVVWVILMIRQHRLQAKELQQELDELGR